MAEFVRVRWKATGHQSTIAAHRVDARHVVLKRPALDRNGDPVPPKYKTTVAAMATDTADHDGQQPTNTGGDN